MAEKENIKDKLENLKEGHRKSNKDIIESLFAILGYLKNNTDVDNPTSQTQMRKVEEISEYLGTKSTFHNKMVNMAIALDSADGVTLNERRDYEFEDDNGNKDIVTLANVRQANKFKKLSHTLFDKLLIFFLNLQTISYIIVNCHKREERIALKNKSDTSFI